MLLLVDLDGVVYRGPEPVPGVAEVLVRRAGLGDGIVYVTNNSMHYRADYVARLRSMGLPVTPDRVVSAPRATALYLIEHNPPARRVLAGVAAGAGVIPGSGTRSSSVIRGTSARGSTGPIW